MFKRLSPSEKREVLTLLLIFVVFLLLFVNTKSRLRVSPQTKETISGAPRIIQINPEVLKSPFFDSLIEIQKISLPQQVGKLDPFE